MSVNKDIDVEGGLFAHYDAALEACQSALGSTGGQLDAPIRARDGHQAVVVAAAVAAGSVRLVGRAIDAYNGRVDELNATWRAAKAVNFGVAPVDCGEAATEAELRQATVHHADQLLDAKLALLSELERTHGEIRRELDTAIAAATGLLAQGPTADVLRELVAAGGVPSAVLGPDPSGDPSH
jgi:hypothetical protein